MPRLFFLILSLLLLTGCFSQFSQPPAQPAGQTPNATSASQTVSSVSLPALMTKAMVGADFTVGQLLAETVAYKRYFIAYKSGSLTISGIMNVPKGSGPFPVIITNHGYIDPAIYTNGRGLKREQDYIASRGYVVIHPDYRNHAESDDDPDYELSLRLGYTEDVINLISAIKEAKLDYMDTGKIGMLGHSMGGGVTQNTLVVKPDLVQAAVLFAPVSSDYTDNFNKWTRGDSDNNRRELADKIISLYGSPTSSPEFWANVSSRTFFDKIQTPILLHHGTADESVPIEWSEESVQALTDLNKDITFYVYEGEPHEFAAAWPLVMQRTVEFFDQHLK